MRVESPQVAQVNAAAADARRPAAAPAMSFDAQLEHASRRPAVPRAAAPSAAPLAPSAAPPAPSRDAQLEHAALRGGAVAPPAVPEAPAPAPPAEAKPRATAPRLTADERASRELERRHDLKGPRTETYARVPGHPNFVEVTAGPRNGMFVNVSGNERHGQAFVRVTRGNHILHIYGKGEDRVVIAHRRPASSYKPAAGAPRNETYADIPNHREYDEITSGPRNGMFINRSGNARDGLAFVRVERGDRVFHVYGKGDDRLVIEVHGHWKPAPEIPAARVRRPE